MESQKHATRFGIKYDIYSALWRHKPMKELGFECDFVKLSGFQNCKRSSGAPEVKQATAAGGDILIVAGARAGGGCEAHRSFDRTARRMRSS
jgi:hypothetical protein